MYVFVWTDSIRFLKHCEKYKYKYCILYKGVRKSIALPIWVTKEYFADDWVESVKWFPLFSFFLLNGCECAICLLVWWDNEYNSTQVDVYVFMFSIVLYLYISFCFCFLCIVFYSICKLRVQIMNSRNCFFFPTKWHFIPLLVYKEIQIKL